MAANPEIMDKFLITGPLQMIGWLGSVVITAAVVGMGLTLLVGN
jgi:hypothetical protein